MPQSGQSKEFILQLGNDEISVIYINQTVKVTLINSRLFQISQQTYAAPNLPFLPQHPYKSPEEFYRYLEEAHHKLENWSVQDPATVVVQPNPTESIQLALKKLTDQQEFARILLIKMLQTRIEAKNVKIETNDDIKRMKEMQDAHQKDMAARLKGIGELVKSLSQEIDKRGDQIRIVNNNMEGFKNRLEQVRKDVNKTMEEFDKLQEHVDVQDKEVEMRSEEGIKNVRHELEITQKTISRNFATLKEEFNTQNAKVEEQIQQIWLEINKYDLPKMKENVKHVMQAFDLEIRIKDFDFKPHPQTIQNNKKLYFLNKKFLKNLEDSRDYNKIMGDTPIPLGRFKLRILIKNIKNNGLLFGICSSKIKDSLEKTSFNDPHMVTLNSCGYIINRGIMTMSQASLKNGDVIRMLVDTHMGEVRWACNDIEVAIADMGPLKNEEVYPLVGLGYFGDQVELLENTNTKVSDKQNESYRDELERLNHRINRKQ